MKNFQREAALSEHEVEERWLADMRMRLRALASAYPVTGAVPYVSTKNDAESERWDVGHTYGLSANEISSVMVSATQQAPDASNAGGSDMSHPMGSEGSGNEPASPLASLPVAAASGGRGVTRAISLAVSAHDAPIVPVPTSGAGPPPNGGVGSPIRGDGPSTGGGNAPSGTSSGPTFTYYRQVNGAICKVDKLSTNFWGWITGATRFKTKRYVIKEAALLTATYQGVDEMEEDHLKVDAVVSVAESIKQAACSTLCKPLKHSVVHRSANRFQKRVRVIKAIVNAVRFKAPTEFTQSDADRRCLRLALVGVIEEGVKDGIRLHDEDPGGERGQFPYHQVKIRGDEKAFYLKACSTAYYINDGDEEFWEALVPKVLSPAK